MYSYKKKKKFISTTKGDSLLAFLIDKQFSKLNSDSLNIKTTPSDTTFLSISHCPTTEIYFYHQNKIANKQVYCLSLYYNSAHNSHKARFSECSDLLSKFIEEELEK